MNPVVDGLISAVLRYFGKIVVGLCVLSLVLLLAAWAVSRPESLATVADSMQRLRTTALLWLGKGCLMIIAADVLDGKFKWRKDD